MEPTTATTTTPGLSSDDPRSVFGRATATATATVANVGDDQLVAPTPCSEMDVAALLAHLLGVLHRVAALGRGEDPFAVEEEAVASDRLGQWTAAAHEVQEAWSDPGVLERPMALPWQQGTGGDILLGYVGELVVHTWDLAVATGQHPAWDDDVLDAALATGSNLPAEGRLAMFERISAEMGLDETAVPFAEAVPVPEGADAIDRLVAWNGRDPRWAPTRG